MRGGPLRSSRPDYLNFRSPYRAPFDASAGQVAWTPRPVPADLAHRGQRGQRGVAFEQIGTLGTRGP